MTSGKKTIILLVSIVGIGISIAAARSNQIFMNFGKNAHVIFYDSNAETKIFVDNQKETARERDGAYTLKVRPGLRDILVSRDGYWPWLKQLTFTEGETKKVHPFFFPKEIFVNEIKGDDPEYDALIAMARAQKAPTARDMLISKDSTVTVWSENGSLKARAKGTEIPPFFCTNTTCTDTEMTFLSTEFPVKNVAFWKERNDVVIVAVGDQIYALELDRRSVQNFQPIYKGENPNFFIGNDGVFYIFDKGMLLESRIE